MILMKKKLNQALYNVVESVVNYVGVDVNRASPELLSYIAGINKRCAKNIVEYTRRILTENKTRKSL